MNEKSVKMWWVVGSETRVKVVLYRAELRAYRLTEIQTLRKRRKVKLARAFRPCQARPGQPTRAARS
jgi:hypothetical protein